jgi:hypothetical protein
MRLQQFIDRLEEFCTLHGVSVFRTPEEHLDRTVCEYEAEAVEKLVGGYLGLKGTAIDLTTVTDDLHACSVARVRWVARTLLTATGAGRRPDPDNAR